MYSIKRQCTIKWTDVNIKMIDLFQDPTYESYIEATEFVKIYGPILKTLNGIEQNDYFDYYFCQSPLNSSIYEFVDRRIRKKFRELAEKSKIVPSLKEVSEGENSSLKKTNLISQGENSSLKKTNLISQGENHKDIIRRRPSTEFKEQPRIIIDKEKLIQKIDTLASRLQNETDPHMQEIIGNKIRKALNAIQRTI
jgi:hypothetical protein